MQLAQEDDRGSPFDHVSIIISMSVEGGFQTVVRVFWGNELPLRPLYLNLTSFLPQFYLYLTSFYLFFSDESRTRFTDSWLYLS